MGRVLSPYRILVPIGLLAVALVAGCATRGARPASAGPSAPPPSVTQAACPATGLRAAASEIAAAMGLRAMTVNLVNCGNRAVTLNGYPGARLADEDGDRLTIAVKHGVSAVAMIDALEFPPRRFTLRPGETAESHFVWRNTTEFTPDGPATATALDVAVADGRPYQAVPLPGSMDLGTTGKLAVSPWRPAPPAAAPPASGKSSAPRPLV